MKSIKAYKVRCFPTQEQQELILKTFGCCRWYWNQALADNISFYNENKRIKINTPASYKQEYSWLKEVDASALDFTKINLQNAFSDFFKQNRKFPKFRSKKFPKHSYKTMQTKGYKVTENTVKITKLGEVKIVNHKHKTGIAKSCVISMTATHEFYISILWKVENEPENIIIPKTEKEIGIDLGLTDLVICSDGTKFPALRSLRKELKNLKKEQRRLSKMIKGSKNYQRQKLKVAKIYQHTANQRKDYLHKISYKLTNENQVISLENLNVKGMVKNCRLALSIMDAGWSMLIMMLEYKAKDRDRTIIKIDRWFPSSQICSCCGSLTGKKPLNVRSWICPNCGMKHDRDINAAINILNEGKRLIGANICPDR